MKKRNLNSKLIFLFLCIQFTYAQSTQDLINDYFSNQLLLPYSLPEYNHFFEKGKIKSVDIIINDSINYNLVANKHKEIILLSFNTNTFFPYFYNNNIPNWQQYFKASKNYKNTMVNYKIIYTSPYIWVNYNGLEQKTTILNNEIWIENSDKKDYYSKYEVKYNKGKIKSITNYSLPIKKYIGMKEFEFTNDTIVVEKLYRGNSLASKKIHFFNKRGLIINSRLFYYETIEIGEDYYGFEYGRGSVFMFEKYYKYKYDKYDNWIECIEYNWNEIEVVKKTQRIITYED